MSVVINSNAAATVAGNNLAASNLLLQRSLNRLASGSKIVNPSDDAGGLAVSMKLSAAARRQGAVANNLGNTASYLQTQDGALKIAGKVLDRISELKTLASDPTKNASDLANYDAEFSELQGQLTALGSETFNTIGLFGSNALSVATTEDGATALSLPGIDLLGGGGGGGPAWTNISGVVPGADWTSSSASITNAAGYLKFHADGTATTTQSNISGPFTISFTYNLMHDGSGTATLSAGGSNSLDLHSVVPLFDVADHTMSITVDGNGDAAWSFDSGAQTGNITDFAADSGAALQFAVTGSASSDLHVKNDFALTSTGGGGGGGGATNVGDVTAASSLSALALSSITGAIEDVATHRAANGALQSRVAFASELLSVNKANLEAANSRITDVDVAEESTQLARYNILVQAGTSMLSQANQSAQSALKLLG
jgi:flagellin